MKINMKRNLYIKTATVAAFIGFIICFGAQTARAQVQPIVDCIELRNSPQSSDNGFYVYFGYINYGAAPVTIPTTSNSNRLTPVSAPGQPTVFLPGIHPRVFSVKLTGTNEATWMLTRYTIRVTNSSTEYRVCNTDGANARLTTFQGKLNDGNQPANGVYDFRFQLFGTPTGGVAHTLPIALEDVPVVNGIFTVQLDLGANNLVYPGGLSGEPFPFSQTVNSHLAAGEDGFFDIGVRPGSATGDYTFLMPRQPLTAVPLAMRANMAHNSIFANRAGDSENLGGTAANQFVRITDGNANYIQNTTTQQANSNFNISGNGTVGGTLTANVVTANSLRAHGGAPGPDNANNNGYAFSGSGDNDSGLFSNGNGQVSLYTDSIERARVTSSGLQVFGTLTANTKNFKIDHPLDPLNKTLTYTSIESPDMMNIYNGNVTTDGNGEAIVKMPDYFEALNRDFRYQLTVIGTFAQAIVLEKIKGNQFKIKSDKPHVEVSWQITGVRRDKYAEDNRPPVEETKSAEDKGKCIYAPACRNDR